MIGGVDYTLRSLRVNWIKALTFKDYTCLQVYLCYLGVFILVYLSCQLYWIDLICVTGSLDTPHMVNDAFRPGSCKL